MLKKGRREGAPAVGRNGNENVKLGRRKSLPAGLGFAPFRDKRVLNGLG